MNLRHNKLFIACIAISFGFHWISFESLRSASRFLTSLVSHRPLPTKFERELTLLELSPTKKVMPDPSGQMVLQDEKSLNKKTPQNTKYMSRNDQSVTKQTQASRNGDFVNSDGQNSKSKNAKSESAKEAVANEAISTQTSPPNPAPIKTKPVDHRQVSETIADKSKKDDGKTPEPKASARPNEAIDTNSSPEKHVLTSDDGVEVEKVNTASAQTNSAKTAETSSTEPGHEKADLNVPLANLMPKSPLDPTYSSEDRRDSNLSSATHDYLEGVELSKKTQLNTREYLYYSYFSRIESRLYQNWVPIIREKMVDRWRRGRTIASTGKDPLTQLLMLLDPRGKIVKVEIQNESGVMEYDDAAVEALKVSAVFPNPPRDLIDPDGFVRIRWSFRITN